LDSLTIYQIYKNLTDLIIKSNSWNG